MLKQLCKDLNRDFHKEELYVLAVKLGLPINKATTKKELCEMIAESKLLDEETLANDIYLPIEQKSCNYSFRYPNKEGYLYLFNKSPNPIKETVAKDPLIVTDYVDPYYLNLLGDITQRYVHRIKLAKPLKKIGSDEWWSSSHKFIKSVYENDETRNNYSGYTTHRQGRGGVIFPSYENVYPVLINTADIIEDKVVFDFFDPKVNEDNPLSEVQTRLGLALVEGETAFTILHDYMTCSDAEFQSEDLLKMFGDNPIVDPTLKKYTLYRGFSWETKEEFGEFINHCKEKGIIGRSNLISSWTSNLCIAETFATTVNYGVILKHDFKPSDILIDTRIIDPATLGKLYHQTQREVIVKPGEYLCQIIMTFHYDPESDRKLHAFDANGKEIRYNDL